MAGLGKNMFLVGHICDWLNKVILIKTKAKIFSYVILDTQDCMIQVKTIWIHFLKQNTVITSDTLTAFKMSQACNGIGAGTVLAFIMGKLDYLAGRFIHKIWIINLYIRPRKRVVCPFGLKIGRVSRSIFFFFFFILMLEKCIFCFLYLNKWHQSIWWGHVWSKQIPSVPKQ